MNLSLPAARAARLHGARTALIDGERRWSYQEFDELVDRLASGLARRFAAGARVGVMMGNRAEAVMLQFALERAALVRVPVNVRYTGHELGVIMDDCGAAALFFDSAARPAFEAASGLALEGIAVDGADSCWQALCQARAEAGLLHRAGPQTLATINYTSGTTGAPKGVMLSHGNWLAVYRNMLVDRDLRGDDVVAYVGPMTHASGAYLAPWYWRGACNIIVSPASGSRLLDLIEQNRVTAFTCVPTFLTRLLAVPGLAGRRLDSLRLIGYGAEPIPANTLARAWEVFGPILWQNYGQTEAMMTCVHLPPALHQAPGPDGRPRLRHGLLGIPYTYVEVVVRASDGEPVPAGEIGELTVRADHVMQGYWNRPQATAQALRDGWLWTGDLAVQDEAGVLRLVGRSKDMLICGGFNIYPAEIEASLTALPGVREAAVVARPDPDWGEIAVAFVCPAPGCAHDAGSLAEALRPALGIKTPKAWHIVEDMPRNGNGKIDKKALAVMDRQAATGDTQ